MIQILFNNHQMFSNITPDVLSQVQNEIDLFKDSILNSFDKYINLNSSNKEIKILNYLQKQNIDEALHYANEGIEIYPEFTLSYITRASIYTQMGEIEKALKDCDTMLSYDPAEIDAFNFKNQSTTNTTGITGTRKIYTMLETFKTFEQKLKYLKVYYWFW
ncbi:hypothetical protein ABK040_006613 [Willaertia magna]